MGVHECRKCVYGTIYSVEVIKIMKMQMFIIVDTEKPGSENIKDYT
jgi:hypothetical protein